MLHAVVRSGTKSLYILGEADAYGLDTLEQHVRWMLKGDRDVRLDIELDPAEGRSFAFSGSEWIERLRKIGVSVRIVPRPLCRPLFPSGDGRGQAASSIRFAAIPPCKCSS